MLIRAPAKINLFLRIGRRRADGYHSIVTLFHAVGWFDDLRAEKADRIVLEAAGLPSPRGAGNLVLRAADLLRHETGCTRGASIQLHKRIPVGAGLGGGSSDAAAALLGLNRLWRLQLPRSRLLALAGRLGSDVPFFLLGGAAVGTGRGERLRSVPSRLRAWVVLAKPSFGVTTRDAYAALDRLPPSRRPSPAVPLSDAVRAVRRGDLSGLRVHNDFEAVVFRRHPRLLALKKALLASGARAAVLSGSGSAVVGICGSAATARRTARAIRREFRVWSVSAPLVS